MVLFVAIMVLLLLAVFVFSYNYLARRQYDRMHHEEISEITALLATNGARFLACQMENANSTLGNQLFLELLPLYIHQAVPELNLASGTPAATGAFCAQVAGKFQTLLDSYHYVYQDSLGRFSGGQETHPQCEIMGVAFRKARSILPFKMRDYAKLNQTLLHEMLGAPLRFADETQYQTKMLASGRDGLEKWGELTISCGVYFRGVSRVVTLRKQFRTLSLTPGPYARFTLFSPYTSHEEAFNTVGTTVSGDYSPLPNGEPSPRRLILINGTDTFDTSAPSGALPAHLTKPTEFLPRRGWVFLGPPGDPLDPLRTGNVNLRLPAGFNPSGVAPSLNPFHGYLSQIQNGVGGQIYLTWPKMGLDNPARVVPTPREVTGPAFKPDKTKNPPDTLVSQLVGLYTDGGRGPTMPALNLWHQPDPSDANRMVAITTEDCFSSWLLPYGTRQYISRTLMVGQVHAIFAEYFQLWWDAHPNPPQANFGFIKPFLPQPTVPFSLTQDPASFLLWIGQSPVKPVTYGDFLQPTPGDPTGEGALRKISPKFGNFPGQNFGGIPFNLVFDLMNYGATPPELETWKSLAGPVGIGSIENRRAVPGIMGRRLEDGVVPPDTGEWKQIQPPFLQLWKAEGPNNPSFGAISPPTYFLGNLLECDFRRSGTHPGDFVRWGLLPRVTEIIDLDQVPETQEVSHLLISKVLTVSSRFPGKFLFRRPGIYFLKRSRATDLKIPLPIVLEGPGIIILEKGTLEIKGVESPDVDAEGVSPHLFSLICLDGNIKVPGGFHGGSIPIHAFLVALNPQVGDATGHSASILNSTGLSRDPSSQIFVSGGIAASEVADSPAGAYPTLFSDFFGGGIIRYNPRFNPCTEVRPERYRLIFDPVDLEIDVRGG
jgi:hypothetical protein